MAELLFTGNTKGTNYPLHDFNKGMEWLRPLKIIGADTETNFVESILMRQLKVISIADEQGLTVWVIEWTFLTPNQQVELLAEMKTKLNIYHNYAFDGAVLKKHGVVLEKVYCTYLAEQTLTNGLGKEKGFHGLQAIFKRRFNIDISKDEQLTFGDGKPYSDSQIQYAGIDVLKLGLLRNIQIAEMKAHDKRINQQGNKGMMKSIWWDNEFNKAVVDMESEGVRVDKEVWYGIEDKIKPVYDEELKILNDLIKEHLWDTLEVNNWVSDKDELVVNVWSSSQKKALILDSIYSFPIEKTAKTELKKLLQKHDPVFPEGLKLTGKSWNNSDYSTDLNDDFAILKLLVLNDKTWDATSYLDKFLLQNRREFCINQGWLRKADEVSINWGSWPQRLKIFQAINPAIESTGKEILEDYIDQSPIIAHYLEWASVNHTITSFGKKWYDKNVDIDGKFRTRFNIMLQTGRLSSTDPNLLAIPKRKFDGVFRKAFIPDPGFVLIDCDWDGQELVVVTELSKEPSWAEYLSKGYDLHGMNAALIFGDEWADTANADCAYFAQDSNGNHLYKKCSCAEHKVLRDSAKTTAFASLYGVTFMSLSARLKISQERAKFILKRFFEIVPNIDLMMKRFGNYAIENGLIIEPVFGRVRFFDKWKLAIPEEHSGIRRAAFNSPIQSSGSAMLKIAFVLLRRWINQNNLQEIVQLKLPAHDQGLIQAKPEYVDIAKQALEYFMKKASLLAGFNINATATSGANWLETK